MKNYSRFYAIAFIVSLLVVIVLAPFASPLPDGLERVAEDKGFIEKEAEFPYQVLFPDYEAPFLSSPYFKVIVPGVFGTAVTLLVASGIGYVLAKRSSNNGTRVSG